MKASNDHAESIAAKSPRDSLYHAIISKWMNNGYAEHYLQVAVASAFKLVNFYAPSNLPTTHFLLLHIELHHLENETQDRIKIVDGHLCSIQELKEERDQIERLEWDPSLRKELVSITARHAVEVQQMSRSA
jgi:hypothetical protein